MPVRAKIRHMLQAAFIAALLTAAMPGFARPLRGAPGAMFAQHPMGSHAHPHSNQGRQHGPRAQRREHLEEWMSRHSNLPPAQQQRALENEPGFRQLPEQTQQRLRNRLNQLNNMPPEQRRRFIERNEAMERLTPSERGQVRGAMNQWRALPDDRRRVVARAFHDLREMPVPQRQAIVNSDRFRGQFSDQERNTISDLLKVEPYLPVQHPDQTPQPGK